MVQHTDLWIHLPAGRLFARRWHSAACAADAVPIVLLHDSLGCVELWRQFPEQLCARTQRPVVAYDRLGFGQSDARSPRPGPDFVAQEAREVFPALREQLGLVRFVAMGHSVGGGMAIEVAARFGADCQALVTLAAQVFTEELTLQGIRAAKVQFADPAQLERLRRYHGDKAAWVLDAWTGCWLDPSFADWTLSGVLPQLRCPVLALHGELDEFGSAEHPRRIGQLSGGPTQVDLLAGRGHTPHREDPEAVLECVAGFLRDLADTRPMPG